MPAVDLDALIPEPKVATLGGKEYRLPGDLPMEIYLRVQHAGEKEDDSETSAIEAMLSAMSDLFAWEYPDDAQEEIRSAVGKVMLGRGVKFCLTLVRAIYSDQEEIAQDMADQAAEEAAVVPLRPEEDGMPSTPASATTPDPQAS